MSTTAHIPTQGRASAMRVWAVGAQVSNAASEARFFQNMGAELVASDVRRNDEASSALIQLRVGDLNLHLTERVRYEDGGADRAGWRHIVLQVEDLARSVKVALDSGATELHPRMEIAAAYGVRQVAFLQSPGGIVFELIQVLQEADDAWLRSYDGEPKERYLSSAPPTQGPNDGCHPHDG